MADHDNLLTQLDTLRAGIREIAHEINNPLGVIRMAVYLMESSHQDDAKRKHYVGVINASLDKIEDGLKRLKVLREGTAGDGDETSPPPGS